jgi:hypothetical protein
VAAREDHLPGAVVSGQAQEAGAVVVIGYVYSGTALFRKAVGTLSDSAWLDAPGLVQAAHQLGTLWERLDGRPDGRSKVSPLTRKSIRALLQSMLISRLARDGAKSWLATTSPSPVEALDFFAEIYAEAKFVCLHRRFGDFATAAMAGYGWEIAGKGPGLDDVLLQYPWNPAAALAQYWAGQTQVLLDFQRAHADRCLRVNYADLAEDPEKVRTDFRTFTGWELRSGAADRDGRVSSSAQTVDAMAVPRAKIPADVLLTVNRLMDELGYRDPPGVNGYTASSALRP